MPKHSRIHKPYNGFKGFIRGKGLTYRDVGLLIGVSPTTISPKVNGFSDFYLNEVVKIKVAFGAGTEIFFT